MVPHGTSQVPHRGTILILDTKFRVDRIYGVNALPRSYSKHLLSAHREVKPADPTALWGLLLHLLQERAHTYFVPLTTAEVAVSAQPWLKSRYVEGLVSSAVGGGRLSTAPCVRFM